MISCTIWSWTEPVKKVSISKIASHFNQLICDAVYLQLIEMFLVSNASSAEFKVCAWHAITMLSKLCYDLSVPAKYCGKVKLLSQLWQLWQCVVAYRGMLCGISSTHVVICDMFSCVCKCATPTYGDATERRAPHSKPSKALFWSGEDTAVHTCLCKFY